MSRNTPELHRKNLRFKSKWFDDIKKDNRFYGVGTVNNQIHYPNGAREEHRFEDRSFAYEFKENVVYAYGLLDGYGGSWAVDFVEQCIMTSLYFDHLSTLESKTDAEVIEILQTEFYKTEQTLRDNLQGVLMDRASLTIQAAGLKKGSFEYVSNKKKIEELDMHLDSGSFAMVALIIENRLFLANVGTNHCFIYKYDAKTNDQQVVSVETVHNLANNAEMVRLLNYSGANLEKMSLNYTRCLGDFKIKLYYHEYPEFSDCTSPPIICKPSLHHHSSSILIDDSFLFMVMYPDALAKVIEEADLKGNVKINVKIVKLLVEKILSEQTLNSAAQSVLDEIKRAYDDKFASEYTEREDLTLIIRVFDPNIKTKLAAITTNQANKGTHENLGSRRTKFESTLHTYSNTESNAGSDNEDGYYNTVTTSLSNTEYETESVCELNVGKAEIDKKMDENGCVITYIDLNKEFGMLLKDGKNPFEQLEKELEDLAELDTVTEEK